MKKAVAGDAGRATEAGTGGKEKKRPGKKTRIARRTKARELKAKAEAEAAARTTKEEYIREKKKRLNRLKQLRRRDKEREKKRQKAVGGGLTPASEQNRGSVASVGDAFSE